MVRTKAESTGVKATGAKAPRKGLASTPSRSVSIDSDVKNKTYSGGNSYHPRETPGWQKPITTFFGLPQRDSSKENIPSGGSSADS